MNINAVYLKQLLSYQPDTGAFTWRCNRRGRNARIGAPAGLTRPDGYIRIGIDGRLHYAHRLAWQFERGEIPDGMEIDHIDHDPSNNRISNLRLVTARDNRANQRLGSRNRSGVTGVYWAAHANAWAAQIQAKGVVYVLGYFKAISDAASARKAAEAEHGFHPNHGAV